MYDYMRALHARFCREPELQKAREELEQAYREIKARLGQQDQETLLQLADLENELREETSFAFCCLQSSGRRVPCQKENHLCEAVCKGDLVELIARFELATSSLPRMRSTC